MRWALAAMLAAAAMDLIDTTIVNVAAPAVRADLDAGDAQIEWAVAGYALAFGVGLITGGRLGDRFGRRPCSSQVSPGSC
jgi:MFS family permease